jgi:hypothetical protein
MLAPEENLVRLEIWIEQVEPYKEVGASEEAPTIANA